MRASNKNGAEALLAVPFTFPTKLVIFLSAACIKKECPFSLKMFRHTGYRGHLPSFYIFSRSTKTSQASYYCMVSGRFWTFPLDRIGFSMTVASSLPSTFSNPLLSCLGIKKAPYCCDAFPQYTGKWGFCCVHTYRDLNHPSFPVRTYAPIHHKSRLYRVWQLLQSP